MPGSLMSAMATKVRPSMKGKRREDETSRSREEKQNQRHEKTRQDQRKNKTGYDTNMVRLGANKTR